MQLLCEPALIEANNRLLQLARKERVSEEELGGAHLDFKREAQRAVRSWHLARSAVRCEMWCCEAASGRVAVVAVAVPGATEHSRWQQNQPEQWGS